MFRTEVKGVWSYGRAVLEESFKSVFMYVFDLIFFVGHEMQSFLHVVTRNA
jgi:hypothetical protein